MVNATMICDPAGPEFTLIWSATWRTSHSPWPGSYGHGDVRAAAPGSRAAWRAVTGEAGAGRTRVADLADQFPIGDTHPQAPGSAPVFERVGGQLVRRKHHVERAAFWHACGGCVREHCLARTRSVVSPNSWSSVRLRAHYPSCSRAPAVPESGCGRTVSTWSMPRQHQDPGHVRLGSTSSRVPPWAFSARCASVSARMELESANRSPDRIDGQLPSAVRNLAIERIPRAARGSIDPLHRAGGSPHRMCRRPVRARRAHRRTAARLAHPAGSSAPSAIVGQTPAVRNPEASHLEPDAVEPG